jgi:glycine hydroxymethyltransferase
MILTDDETFSKKLNGAVFPGLQGGPLMHIIAAKAVAFNEALQPDFKDYMANVLKNAQVLGQTLRSGGVDLCTDGTDNHLLLLDLRPFALTGDVVEKAFEDVGLSTNKNTIPFDPGTPRKPSGLRIGSAACTTRGLQAEDFVEIGQIMVNILKSLQNNEFEDSKNGFKEHVQKLCHAFPLSYRRGLVS